jgi:glutathione peroxidase
VQRLNRTPRPGKEFQPKKTSGKTSSPCRAIVEHFCAMPEESTTKQPNGRAPSVSGRAPSIFDHSAELLDGSVISLEEFHGRVLLIVNTASECGFTPQYAGLEALYEKYRDRGFTVLGFPSNQFGRQEPGSAAEIDAFCRTRYRISFPLFAKIDVNGPQAHPLYCYLKREKSGAFGFLLGGRISWNFTKFLVNRSGRVAGRFSPATRPASLAAAIERQLAEPTP